MTKKKIPTIDEVYNHCLKLDPEKYGNLTKSEIQITDGGTVRVRGRFVKGYGGQKKGRPPKVAAPARTDLTKEDLKYFGKDSKKALERMLETATSRSEVKEISKILLPFQKPKLANIESKAVTESKITIEWGDSKGDIIDMSREEYEVQHAAAKALIEDKGENINATGLNKILQGKKKEEEAVHGRSDGDG